MFGCCVIFQPEEHIFQDDLTPCLRVLRFSISLPLPPKAGGGGGRDDRSQTRQTRISSRVHPIFACFAIFQTSAPPPHSPQRGEGRREGEGRSATNPTNTHFKSISPHICVFCFVIFPSFSPLLPKGGGGGGGKIGHKPAKHAKGP